MVYAGNGMNGVTTGCPIYARDGDLLGHVKEMRETAFKVNAPLRPDFWLRWDAVAAASPAGITLGMDKDELSQAYATDPAISGDVPAARAVAAAPSVPSIPSAAEPATPGPTDYVPAENAAPPDFVPSPATTESPPPES